MTGRYKAYPAYVSSGKDYYGDIPEHWNLEKIKYNSYVKGRQGWQNLRADEYQDVGPYLVTGSHFDNKGGVDWNACYRVSEERYERDRDIWIKSGDVLMTKDGTIGKIAFVDSLPYKACLNSHLLIIRDLYSKYDQRFLYHLLTSTAFKGFIPTRQSGTTFMGITQESVEEFPLVICPIEEQQKIANFLDHETAKIDTLIEKQQQLIKLLKEKRQAVISHAVTKGLNPQAPMKDSGVEWLGEVPEHWVTKSYRYACKIYRGKFGHRPRNDPAFYDGEYPFIQTGDVARAGKMITSYSQTLNEKGKEVSQLFPAGTLMMAIAANIGDTAILGFEAYAPDSVVGFKPYADLDIEFLRYSFMAALPALEQTSTQSTQANLNVDRIGAVKAVFPSYDEQREIVEYLDRLLDQYDSIEKRCKKAIALMQERRTALISAAVTGKIDVRNWKSPISQDQALEQTA
ncbi:TPA: restriction endonuclease subunit S [Vibrio vulnificus]|nr:restriction endonuclease subunit S [Vibrio vulnificus]